MINYFHPSHSIVSIPASILSIVFVTLDVVSFAIQLTGGSYASPSDPIDKQMKGVHIYMGGIAIQQFFIFVFVAIAVKFHLEMKKLDQGIGIKSGWTRLLWTLYASLGFVTVSFMLLTVVAECLHTHRLGSSIASLSSQQAKIHRTHCHFMKCTSMHWKPSQCSALLWFSI